MGVPDPFDENDPEFVERLRIAKEKKKINKKNLEGKIEELEGKLSQLSGQVGSKPKVDPRIFKGGGYTRISRGTLPKGFDNPQPKPKPTGTLPRGFEKFAQGVLPKGFSNSPFTTICLMTKKRAKQLYKDEKCLGCGKDVKFDRKKHYILCEQCTSGLDTYELNQVKRILKKYRIKERSKHTPLLKGLLVKLKLAEVKK
jgi:DNA-directed RNA polymerase subunit RPC12/RpoP